jgi:hypothetical protein
MSGLGGCQQKRPPRPGLGAVASMRKQSRATVMANTARPMLLCVCVNSNRSAAL